MSGYQKKMVEGTGLFLGIRFMASSSAPLLSTHINFTVNSGNINLVPPINFEKGTWFQ